MRTVFRNSTKQARIQHPPRRQRWILQNPCSHSIHGSSRRDGEQTKGNMSSVSRHRQALWGKGTPVWVGRRKESFVRCSSNISPKHSEVGSASHFLLATASAASFLKSLRMRFRGSVARVLISIFLFCQSYSHPDATPQMLAFPSAITTMTGLHTVPALCQDREGLSACQHHTLPTLPVYTDPPACQVRWVNDSCRKAAMSQMGRPLFPLGHCDESLGLPGYFG